MELYDSLIYGFIQGLTEFLPVSSSGHLALLPKILKIKDPGIIFDLFMHFGTALAIMFYFKKDIIKLFKGCYGFVCSIFGKSTLSDKSEIFWARNFLIGTFGSVFLIIIFKLLIGDFGRSPLFVGANLIIFGIFLFISDKYSSTSNKLFTSEGSPKSALIIGLSQALAIFPGVSRSGITISAGRILGFSKDEASRFSFLLSLPIIFGGIAEKLFYNDLSNNNVFDGISLFVGVLTSFLVGILTIHFFLKLIRKISFLSFMIYRLILGSAVIYFNY